LAPTAVTTLEEVDELLAQARSIDDNAARNDLLLQYYYEAPGLADVDPFSREYVDEVLRLHAHITGRERYDPRRDELTHDLPPLADLARRPSPYMHGPTDTLGDFFIAFGFVLQRLALRAGQTLIEYGPGTAQLALHCARNGVDVTAIDIEPKYVEVIREQAARIDIPIHAAVGEFGDVPHAGRRYDVVLFFESFHHALDHNRLLRDLHGVVADAGRLVLAGEPIIERGNVWEPAIPPAWGPRTDLMSVWSMRASGWMELGFREAYLRDAAARAGWNVEKHVCPLSFRGNTWILTAAERPERRRRVWLRRPDR
jgi:2-polyprenyl-3-methyl-5-hydroxy-6-metoxy-1,4-benzoquinol methylase